ERSRRPVGSANRPSGPAAVRATGRGRRSVRTPDPAGAGSASSAELGVASSPRRSPAPQADAVSDRAGSAPEARSGSTMPLRSRKTDEPLFPQAPEEDADQVPVDLVATAG